VTEPFAVANDTVSVDFVDKHGNKWHEYAITHRGFEEWMRAFGKTEKDIEQSPYWKSTSDDIDWVASVKLQAAAQKSFS
jgi:ribonucleoside-diphosphate reductase alpha chain